MSSSATIGESDLHALVDGELDPERRRRVEDHLLTHPGDSALVEGWRRQNAALRAAFEPVALEPTPLSLREVAARPPAPQGEGPIETGAVHWGRPGAAPRSPRRPEDIRASRRRQALVSSILTLFAGAAVAAAGLLIFANRGEGPRAPIVSSPAQGYAARAALTYATFAGDARAVEIDAARQADLAAWLSERVGYARIPDLAGAGLRLIGGRVAPGVGAPAGFLLYQRSDGARLGLYFERADASAPQAPRASAGLTIVEWRAAGFAFALVGPLAADAMQAAAERAAAEALTPEPQR